MTGMREVPMWCYALFDALPPLWHILHADELLYRVVSIEHKTPRALCPGLRTTLTARRLYGTVGRSDELRDAVEAVYRLGGRVALRRWVLAEFGWARRPHVTLCAWPPPKPRPSPAGARPSRPLASSDC